ncbi:MULTISPECIES: phosphoglycerate dehydrogenase [unclassified Enterococcus]|uniref:phosphoglycerate dehydrogenase n=1 Tax=unclassified Enterococcus TaxID=2608891 RepID=UPI001A9B8671|nr:phosphoglycerate dehydrogenase [Enterococcus sp. DIV1271a]MBO1300377.1 phosphoglycerate dehydrogenase [Enterococcus sp. DIV1271a]
MTKKIIYSVRPFREEFIEKMKEIAPDYSFQTEVASDELSEIEVSIGWNREYQEEVFASDHLKWVQSISAGVDNLPLNEFADKEILLSNASGIHVESISEHVMGIILGYSRGLFQAQRAQLRKEWLGSAIHYQALEDQKLLIIGTGHIGKKLAQHASVFGLECIGINTSGHPVEGFKETYPLDRLKEILPKATIVVNILPLTDQTKGLFDAKVFEAFDEEAVFINVGRGPSVKTADLITALEHGELAFAALDVFEEEPLAEDSPLWEREDVLITSHIAGQTPHFQTKFMDIFLKNLQSYIENKELEVNEIDLNEGY